MKHLSLQWRITLMSVLLIGVTCISMNLLLCSSGMYYMDTIANTIQGGTVLIDVEGEVSFDPQLVAPDEDLTIIVDGAQGRFRTTNWYITAAVTLLSGILAYFVSGRALKPLRSFASQVEQVQMSNLADMKINEDVLPEFRQFSHSFNQMLERLNNAFAAQRQFTGNAAHELRTPLALMQAQLELFSAEHPDVLPETAAFLSLLREQTERLTQMTKTLLEMSSLQQVARNERIQLAPMVEEIFTDLAPLTDKARHHADGGWRRRHDRQRRADLPAALQPDGKRRQIQSPRRLGAGLRHTGAGKAPDPCLRHRLRHPGGVSAEHLPAILPRGQVPQPGVRRRWFGAFFGVGDRQSPWRLYLGGEKLGEGHHHRGRAAGAINCVRTSDALPVWAGSKAFYKIPGWFSSSFLIPIPCKRRAYVGA